MDFWRFAPVGDLGLPLEGSYESVLVAVSLLVASLGAFVALAVIRRLANVVDPTTRLIWECVGAISMGLGIWAMHFTGMLAFSLPVSVGYDVLVTSASAIPALVGSAIGVRIMTRASSEWWRIQLGGLSLALGIGTMHFVGMEAIQANAVMRYDPLLFTLSIAVAHVLATSALYVRFEIFDRAQANVLIQSVSAVLMGAAVSGMHYTAMASAEFYASPTTRTLSTVVPPPVLAALIVGLVSFLLLLALVGIAVDQRMNNAEDSARDSASLHEALLEAMPDGLVTVNRGGRIESINPAAGTLLGYRSEELVGRQIRELIPMVGDCSEAVDGEPAWLDDLLQVVEIEARKKNGDMFPAELSGSVTRVGAEVLFCLVLRDVSERRAAQLELRLLAAAVEQVGEAIVVIDAEGAVQYVNTAFSRITGFDREEMLGVIPDLLDPDLGDPKLAQEVWDAIRSGEEWGGFFVNHRKDGAPYDTESTLTPIRDASGAITNFVEVRRDMTERHALELQLANARKLESIGQLAAGIAHEINTPTQYVGDNTRFLQDGFSDLLELVTKLRSFLAAAKNASLSPDLVTVAEDSIEAADLDYLVVEIPKAIAQSLEGVERVTKIVRAMKEFSHPSVEKTPTDLNAAIRSTSTVATNEWKYVADLVTDLEEELPPVVCVPGEFNQVVLNMIVNAAHSIADVVGDGSDGKGTITIRTRLVGEWAEIVISDTGKGMTADVQSRVFDQFFTTKGVGKGTGQGLSIAHAVVVQKHGGSIDVDSVPGSGTEFTIRLPIEEDAREGVVA